MNRAGLLIALSVAVVTGIVFALFPQLDITIARFMHDTFDPGFLPAGPFVQFVRDAASWIVALIAAPAFLAVALKLLLPRRPMIIPARAAVLMIVTLVLAPGVLTNLVLKDYWGRP